MMGENISSWLNTVEAKLKAMKEKDRRDVIKALCITYMLDTDVATALGFAEEIKLLYLRIIEPYFQDFVNTLRNAELNLKGEKDGASMYR